MNDSTLNSQKLERLALQSALRSLDARPERFETRPMFLPAFVAAIALGALFSWADVPLFKHPLFLTIEPLFAFALGAALIYLMFRSTAKAQYFYVGQYLDREAMEARLRELGP